MAKAKAKVSGVKNFLRFRKRKQSTSALTENSDPVDRMRYALDTTATTSRAQENGAETEDMVEKIRTAGY